MVELTVRGDYIQAYTPVAASSKSFSRPSFSVQNGLGILAAIAGVALSSDLRLIMCRKVRGGSVRNALIASPQRSPFPARLSPDATYQLAFALRFSWLRLSPLIHC